MPCPDTLTTRGGIEARILSLRAGELKPGYHKSFSELVIEIHEALDSSSIAHSFSGAIALNCHALEPRATDDIDIAISVGSGDAESVFRSMPPGVKWTGQLLRMAEIKGKARLKWLRGITVDLIFSLREYDSLLHSRSQIVPFGTSQIPVVSATDLSIPKATFDRDDHLSGKERDWTDIRNMLTAQTVDVEEALRWVEELAGATSEELNRLKTLVASICP